MTETVTLCGETARNDPAPCVLDQGHAGRHQDADGWTWSFVHKHGRPDVYEITWMSGHVETVQAHQMTYPNTGLAMFASGGSAGMNPDQGAPRVQIHAEINGRWVVTLSAREEDIRTMRLVTEAERIPGAER